MTTNETTQLTSQLKMYQSRFPIIGDKVLINLVNGIQVSKDILVYRKPGGFLRRLMDACSGKDGKRHLLLEGNLLEGQEALLNWVSELTNSLTVSDIALTITQQYLLETRNIIREEKEKLFALTQIVQEIDAKFEKFERDLYKLEIKVAANSDFDRIIAAWEAEKAYVGLPWAIQVTLLAQEVFSSAVIEYEFQNGDRKNFRHYFVDKVLISTRKFFDQIYRLPFYSLAQLLGHSLNMQTSEDLELSSFLIEPVISTEIQKPYIAALGKALEIINNQEGEVITHDDLSLITIGKNAFDNIRSQIYIPRTINTRDFVTIITEEIADRNLAIIQRRKLHDIV